jgi:hypothetical protein
MLQQEKHMVFGDTRKEEDFSSFIEQTIENNPNYKKYHFILDQLNTHKSIAFYTPPHQRH